MSNIHKKLTTKTLLAIMILTSLGIGMTPSANAQMHEPWGFKAQNRASIAALIQQAERGNTNGPSTVIDSSVTSLVCGGDGESSARGNASCVILNNATGGIELAQDAQGDQSAINSVDTKPESDADEVLDLLGGDNEANTH